MSCGDTHWALLQEPLLFDVLARLPLRDKISFESVCKTWCHPLRDQPAPGTWGDTFFLSNSHRYTAAGFQLFPASQIVQSRQINSVIRWLQRRATGFQAISFGFDDGSHRLCFKIHQFNIALLNWLLHQLEKIKGLPALKLHMCCTEINHRPKFNASQGSSGRPSGCGSRCHLTYIELVHCRE